MVCARLDVSRSRKGYMYVYVYGGPERVWRLFCRFRRHGALPSECKKTDKKAKKSRHVAASARPHLLPSPSPVSDDFRALVHWAVAQVVQTHRHAGADALEEAGAGLGVAYRGLDRGLYRGLGEMMGAM